MPQAAGAAAEPGSLRGSPTQSAFYWDLGWVRGEGEEDSGERQATEMGNGGRRHERAWVAQF